MRSIGSGGIKTIFLFLVLISSFVFISGCSYPTGNSTLGFKDPENLMMFLENSMNKKDFQDLASVFSDNDYAFVLKELYFAMDENITLIYGFPSDEDLKKPIVTTKDIEITIPGKIKYIDEYNALSAIYLDSTRTKLFAGIVLQKIDGYWKITRMYDFMVFNSTMVDIKNFNLDFFTKRFSMTVMLSDNIRKKGLQTTYLYNTYLILDKIEVNYHNMNLCNFDKKNIVIKVRDRIVTPDPGDLIIVDEMLIEGECDYSAIVSPDLEQKYLLEILLHLDTGEVVKAYYYGDLRL
ncbi:MAG: hypothetical protein ACLFPQ_00325 [Candidatus Woesearchaeota archaeon]